MVRSFDSTIQREYIVAKLNSVLSKPSKMNTHDAGSKANDEKEEFKKA